MKRDFRWESLANIDSRRAGRAAYSALNVLQNFSPEEQVAAAGILFSALLRQYRQHAGNVLQVTNNIVDRAVESCPELKGLIAYTREEL